MIPGSGLLFGPPCTVHSIGIADIAISRC